MINGLPPGAVLFTEEQMKEARHVQELLLNFLRERNIPHSVGGMAMFLILEKLKGEGLDFFIKTMDFINVDGERHD
jgi:hypothetical protein